MTTKTKKKPASSKPVTIARLCREWKKRGVPRKVAAMRRLVEHSWGLAHQLADAGVKFAGTREEAALTIAGTAYAAWRLSHEPTVEHEPGDAVGVAEAIAEGVWFATNHGGGQLPVLYADGLAELAKRSTCLIDLVPPLAVLSSMWPDRFTATGLRLAQPEAEEAVSDLEASLWEPRPSILTTPAAAVLAVARRSRARRKNAGRRSSKVGGAA